MLNVTFFPACVALEVPGEEPVLLDLGTGLVAWVRTLDDHRPMRARALLTRAHLDHLAGLSLVGQALAAEGARLDVYGPSRDGGRLSRAVAAALGPGPVPGGDIRFVGVDEEELAVGDAKVTVRRAPHPDQANGYRVDWQGVSVAYLGAHQQPPGRDTVAHEVLELADGADLLVHDSSTVDYAVLVAREAGARCLALLDHRPDRDDAGRGRILAGARRTAERLGVPEVLAGAGGTTVSFERSGR